MIRCKWDIKELFTYDLAKYSNCYCCNPDVEKTVKTVKSCSKCKYYQPKAKIIDEDNKRKSKRLGSASRSAVGGININK